jgi:hypothetical protein
MCCLGSDLPANVVSMTYESLNASRWGKLTFFAVPSDVVMQERLRISPAAVKVLLVLYHAARQQQHHRKQRLSAHPVLVKMTQQTLAEKTGMSAPTIRKAFADLEESCFVECQQQGRKQNGTQFASNEYKLLNPTTADPLINFYGSKLIYGNGSLPFFTVPTSFITEHDKPWSLASLSASAVAIYICLLWRANFLRSNELTIDSAFLWKLTGIKSNDTVRTARKELEDCYLIAVQGTRALKIVINDPHTRELPQPRNADPENAANLFVTDEKGRRKTLDLNVEFSRPAYVQRLLRECLPNASIEARGSDQIAVECPWHSDSNPSLIITFSEQKYWCFGCESLGAEHHGSLPWLVKRIRNCSTAEAKVFMAQTAGAEFVPQHNVSVEAAAERADAVYEWEDEFGLAGHRKLRNGFGKNKELLWQHRDGLADEWKWGKGRKPIPLLYSLPDVAFANTVLIVEGERDAENFRALGLKDAEGKLIAATTSGNAGSWKPVIAKKYLEGKRVILCPDNDQPGQGFRLKVEQSLQRYRIPYRVISFDGADINDLSDWLEAGGTADDLAWRINAAQIIGTGNAGSWVSVPELESEFAEVTL